MKFILFIVLLYCETIYSQEKIAILTDKSCLNLSSEIIIVENGVSRIYVHNSSLISTAEDNELKLYNAMQELYGRGYNIISSNHYQYGESGKYCLFTRYIFELKKKQTK